MAATIQPGTTSPSTSITRTARTRILSATGSSSEPSADVRPRLRPIPPSTQSVAIATQNSAVAQ